MQRGNPATKRLKRGKLSQSLYKAEFYEKQSFMLIGRFIGEKEEELSTMLKQL